VVSNNKESEGVSRGKEKRESIVKNGFFSGGDKGSKGVVGL